MFYFVVLQKYMKNNIMLLDMNFRSMRKNAERKNAQ
ncbi:Hypothetical protein DEACI_2932 [Acididesulfobacillus acetoxydans]|uniref:Uncharacterized protein n=1 Tax=Acididesulfobacillus acetoxydans TaxID=1561005 RepID=A0A8S0W911_9FIRM|nr:Hypothetical protein DEACI_2932 [Acididesulfobacillus acetoxydans]CEJ07523.1 Hypothetical protein DEACI_1989 [Acididesulfobacillus acetoxydans]